MPPRNIPTTTEKASTTSVRLTVSRWLGQATLRSSERTSRTKSSGLPLPRRPPAPASGTGRGAAAPAATAVPRPRPPPEPITAPRRAFGSSPFGPVRPLLDCVLLVWATEGILSLHPGCDNGHRQARVRRNSITQSRPDCQLPRPAARSHPVTVRALRVGPRD
jgi:hypothetical protein